MKKTTYYGLFIAICLSLLAGCSILSPVSGDQNHYVLNKLPPIPAKKTPHPVTLLVARPDATVFYKTNQMAYSTHPYQIAYFAKNVWATSPTDMLQSLIIQSLLNTHYYHAVIPPGVSARYDYVLNTQVEKLLQDYTASPGMLRLIVKAEIVRMANYKIVASKQFVVNVPISPTSPCGGVVAANKATADMLRQLTDFCLDHT